MSTKKELDQARPRCAGLRTVTSTCVTPNVAPRVSRLAIASQSYSRAPRRCDRAQRRLQRPTTCQVAAGLPHGLALPHAGSAGSILLDPQPLSVYVHRHREDASTHHMGYPTSDSKLRGLAAVTFHNEIPNWEFDIQAVPPGVDPPRTPDWCRRGGDRKSRASSRRAAAAAILPSPLEGQHGRRR